MKITSKQWKEFKEWREDETLKVRKSKEYSELTDKKMKELEVKWPQRINLVCVDIFSHKRDALFSHIPDKTLENCTIWLLDNDKIK